MVCFSVRTGWDLYLRGLELGEGDEVMMSAVNHPDMARIARGHGLGVVVVDLDPTTLSPRTEDLEAALSGRTRVVLVAHLFGGRAELGPVARFAAEHGLLLVEDCAQAFVGPGDVGDSRADASLYSFGMLKTATALGGAVVRVKDAGVLARMRRAEAGYPVQGRFRYASRLLRGLVLLCATGPCVYGALLGACTRLGIDVEGLLGRATRSFAAGGAVRALFQRIRRRPGAPMLALLARRLERFDPHALAARAAAGERLAASLGPSVFRPGLRGEIGTHWLFPVAVRNPDRLVRELRGRGFDASRATSSIAALRPSGETPVPAEAAGMMEGIVFLPAYPALPQRDRDRLAAAVRDLAVAAGPVRVVSP